MVKYLWTTPVLHPKGFPQASWWCLALVGLPSPFSRLDVFETSMDTWPCMFLFKDFWEYLGCLMFTLTISCIIHNYPVNDRQVCTSKNTWTFTDLDGRSPYIRSSSWEYLRLAMNNPSNSSQGKPSGAGNDWKDVEGVALDLVTS